MKVSANETLQYVCTVCLLFVLAVCDYEHTCTPETFSGPPHPQGACGPRIDEIYNLICSARLKRSMGDIDTGKGRRIFDPDIVQSSLVSKPVKKRLSNPDAYSQSRALQFLRSRRVPYEDQNIVCECCYHQCSVAEWMQYC